MLAYRHPSRTLAGRILVTDLPHGEGVLSVCAVDPEAVEVSLEVPSGWLFEEPAVQRRLLSGLSWKQGSRKGERGSAAPSEECRPLCHRRLVQFIHCASLFEQRERRFCAVPPAAFYMAPALQRKGFQVCVDSLTIEPFAAPDHSPPDLREANQERLDRILERKPFCVALTAMDFYLEELSGLVREIRARDRDVIIAVGGPLCTLYPEKAPLYLEEGNVFIRGEADLAFGDVLGSLGSFRAGGNLSRKEACRTGGQTGICLRFGRSLLVANLDQTNRIPSLDAVFREPVDLGFIRREHLAGGLHLHTTRGCPYQCSFCTKVHGSHVRAMSGPTLFRILSAYRERVDAIHRAEGLSERERHKAFQVTLSDDDFLLARSRAKAFFLRLSDQPFRIRTVPSGIPSFLSRGEAKETEFDPGLLEAIRAARTKIRSFEIGTDDFAEREISRLAKGHPRGYGLEEIEEVVGRFEELGISNRHFVILGNPSTCWSDLFEKLISLEDLSWRYSRFRPDPNPFVLAPAGTPLFARLVRQQRMDARTSRRFAVPGFPEFTHSVFNMAPPREGLFSTARVSHVAFFRRLSDLLKGRSRFSIFGDAYLHYLDVCRSIDPTCIETEEKERILDQLARAARLRTGRVLSQLAEQRLPSVGEDADAGGTFLAHTVSGLFLLHGTVARLFPEPGLLRKRQALLRALDGFFDQVGTGSSLRVHLPAALCRDLDRALHFGRAQVGLCLAGGGTGPANRIAEKYAFGIGNRLADMGLYDEAREWNELCSAQTDIVRLDVTDDKQDAGFVEDASKIERLSGLLDRAEPGWGSKEDMLRFMRAERVFERSIRDDLLSASETRVSLYDGMEGLPLELKERVQEEFGMSSFLDRDGFLCAVVSKFLVACEMRHPSGLHGTFVFQGMEKALQEIIPEHLKAFARWFFRGAPNQRITS
jgi:hypothetical protein